MAIFNGFKQPFARERLTVSSTVKTLTATVYNDASSSVDLRQRASGARVTVETAGLRWTEEGTDPNIGVGTEVGSLAAVGDAIYLDGYNAVARLKMLRSTGTDAAVEVTYYR